jgi:multiple sugar transport system permease protein
VSGTRALKWGGILFLLIPIILVDLFPLVVMVSTSFKTQQEVFQQPPTFIPRQPTLRNYADIWQAVSLATYFRNSLLIGLGAMALAMLLAVPASYALARFRFKGRLAYLLFLLVIQMFPTVVIILALFRVISAFGMLDNLATLIILDAVFSLSFDVWLLTSYFSSIPPEIEEAAMMDGNSRLGAMLRMTLPLSAPGIVAVAIFTFIDAWNEFLFALTFVRSSDSYPLTLGLFKFVSKFQVAWHQLEAASTVVTAVVLVLFMLVQRHLTRGLVAGAER